jgi:hypothetical protein
MIAPPSAGVKSIFRDPQSHPIPSRSHEARGTCQWQGYAYHSSPSLRCAMREGRSGMRSLKAQAGVVCVTLCTSQCPPQHHRDQGQPNPNLPNDNRMFSHSRTSHGRSGMRIAPLSTHQYTTPGLECQELFAAALAPSLPGVPPIHPWLVDRRFGGPGVGVSI